MAALIIWDKVVLNMRACIQLKKYLGKRNSEKSVMKMKINLSNKQLNIKIKTFIKE